MTNDQLTNAPTFLRFGGNFPFGLATDMTNDVRPATNRPRRLNVEQDLPDWDRIVREHGPMAFETAWRILGHAADTEDAVQEALLEAFELRRAQPVNNWGGLLRRMVTFRALDALRRRRRTEPLGHDPPSGPGTQPDAVAEEQELAARLRAALARLPHRESEVFSLRFFGELSNAEIAEQLDIPAGAVGVALHKARSRLETLLGVRERPSV